MSDNINTGPDCRILTSNELKGHWRLFVSLSSFYIFSGYVC